MRKTSEFPDVLANARPTVLLVPIWALGNLFAWLGGASWRGIGNRHERSLYQLSGFFVVLNGCIAWALFTLAALGIDETTTVVETAPYTVLWGLFVGGFDRSICAKIVDPAEPKGKKVAGYVMRGVFAVLLGFAIAEGGALWIFREDIARTMNNNISSQVAESRSMIVGSDDDPSERARKLQTLEQQRTQLNTDVDTTQAAYLKAEQLVLCEDKPQSCPPDVLASGQVTGDEGDGPATRARKAERDVAMAARDAAINARNQRADGLNAEIAALRTAINGDLDRAEEVARSADGLPARWRAMLDFTGDSSGLLMHLMLIGGCVLLDLIPLLLKLWRGSTTYDATVVASRQRRNRVLAYEGERHDATLRTQSERARIDEELEIGRAELRADSTMKVETERERIRVKTEIAAMWKEQAEPSLQPAPEPAAEPEPERNGAPRVEENALVHVVDRDDDSVDYPEHWTSDDRALVGRMFGGRFHLVEPLEGADTGAFGRMLLAKDTARSNQRVVVKAVRDVAGDRRRLGKSSLRRMWQREVRAAGTLDHRNIGEIIRSGVDHGYLWTASPLYESGSLMRWVRRSVDGWPEGYPLEMTIKYVEQLTNALVYAHDKDVTHGDIKPTNAVLGGLTLFLVDWGFSRVANQFEQDDAEPLGATPLFTAPEAVLDKNFDPRVADLYSLGATWYFLLTGRPPYSDVDQRERAPVIARQVRDGAVELVRLDELLANLPREVVELVHSLVAVDPRQRLVGNPLDAPAVQLQQALKMTVFEVTRAGQSVVPVGPAAVTAGRGKAASVLPMTVLEVPVSGLFAGDVSYGDTVVVDDVIPSHLLLAEPTAPVADGVVPTEPIDEPDQ